MRQTVAVGMPVTQHPPPSSRRAARPHRAPAVGRDAQALRGRRLPTVGCWKPVGGASVHPLPGQALALTAPSSGATPVAASTFPDDPAPAPGARDPRGPGVPSDTTREPCPARLAGPVQPRAQGRRDLLALRAEPWGDGTAPHRPLASRGGAAPGRQAEDVDGRWVPWATPLAPCTGPPPTRTAARRVRVPCAGAPVAALPQGAHTRLGGGCGLEADPARGTVAPAHDVAPCVPAAPLGGPAVHARGARALRQHRAGTAPVGRPFRLGSPVPRLQHARGAPRTAGADDARVPTPGRDTRPQPGVVTRLVQTPPSGIASPGEGALCPADRDGLHRGGRAASWAGTGRAPAPRVRGDGGAPLACRPRDAGVVPRRRAAGSLATRSGRPGDARDRWGLLGAPLQAL